MNKSNLTPVVRNNKFYSEEDFQYECSLLEEFIEEDLNQCIVVYEVDRVKTNTDSIYKESKQAIRYKAPKELPCIFEIKESATKSYDSTNSNGVYAISGNLTANIPVFMFEKYNCDIKRGDYVGVQIDTQRMSYFVVTDDGKINTANTNYLGSYKPVWRTIQATATVEFNGQ